MVSPTFSIIVPVYNAENSLHRCVDSILNQTFTDFELILVDDGSPDNSGKICDEYSNTDSRIYVCHKPNGGVGSARQAGHDRARGEFVIHVDPDDWVESQMLEEMLAAARKAEADVLIADFYAHYNPNHTIIHKEVLHDFRPSDVLAGLLMGDVHGSLCNKMIRRSAIQNNNIRFLDGVNFCEDLYICIELMKDNSLKVAHINKAYYHYDMFCNQSSITKSYTQSMVNNFEAVIDAAFVNLDRYGDYQSHYGSMVVRLQHYAFLSNCKKARYYECVDRLPRRFILQSLKTARLSKEMRYVEQIAVKGYFRLGLLIHILYTAAMKLFHQV